jgi:hypothetical protein
MTRWSGKTAPAQHQKSPREQEYGMKLPETEKER